MRRVKPECPLDPIKKFSRIFQLAAPKGLNYLASACGKISNSLMATEAIHVYQFGAFRLDAGNRLLYREGDVIALPPKVFDTLLLLVTNSGQVLAKDEMMKRLWPDTFVEEGTLAQYIFLLRKALGNSAAWIENHPRRGYRFTAPVEECDGELVTDQGRIGRFRTIVAALVIAGAVMVAALAWINQKGKAPSPVGSVAVLPFRTVSDSGDDYRADGITDAMITKLANLKGLRVVSYSRVRQFKGASVEAADIGRKLGVEAVIEGTMRIASGQIRLSVHGVDTKTADTLWAEDSFDTTPSGLLNIERQLVERVALRLRGPLTGTERGLIMKSGTRNVEAYDLVLRARAALRNPGTAARCRHSGESGVIGAVAGTGSSDRPRICGCLRLARIRPASGIRRRAGAGNALGGDFQRKPGAFDRSELTDRDSGAGVYPTLDGTRSGRVADGQAGSRHQSGRSGCDSGSR